MQMRKAPIWDTAHIERASPESSFCSTNINSCAISIGVHFFQSFNLYREYAFEKRHLIKRGKAWISRYNKDHPGSLQSFLWTGQILSLLDIKLLVDTQSILKKSWKKLRIYFLSDLLKKDFIYCIKCTFVDCCQDISASCASPLPNDEKSIAIIAITAFSKK